MPSRPKVDSWPRVTLLPLPTAPDIRLLPPLNSFFFCILLGFPLATFKLFLLLHITRISTYCQQPLNSFFFCILLKFPPATFKLFLHSIQIPFCQTGPQYNPFLELDCWTFTCRPTLSCFFFLSRLVQFHLVRGVLDTIPFLNWSILADRWLLSISKIFSVLHHCPPNPCDILQYTSIPGLNTNTRIFQYKIPVFLEFWYSTLGIRLFSKTFIGF